MVFFCSLLVSGNAIAQGAAPAYIDGNQCRHIAVDAARVACYDALTDSIRTGQGQPVISRPSVSAAPAAPAVPALQSNYRDSRLQEDYRLMQEELARRRNEGSGQDFGLNKQRITYEDGKEVMYDTVASLAKVQDGWLVTLESGQIWKQTVYKNYRLQEGHEVRIYPTRWGDNYRLAATDLGGFIQVERVK